MNQKFFGVLAVLAALVSIACQNPVVDRRANDTPPVSRSGAPNFDMAGDPEIFDDANRPNFAMDASGGFLCLPWNYETAANAERKYPLLVYLHDSGQANYFKNLAYLGFENPNGYKLESAKQFKKTYPGFVYIPQTAGSWNVDILMAAIDGLKATYRIDTDRIYIHGFGIGGSAALELANAYAGSQLFAGIIRMNGKQTTVTDEVLAKTSLWYMVGLKDKQARIDAIRFDYDFVRNHLAGTGVTETAKLDYLSGPASGNHFANTLTLAHETGIEIAKETEFINDAYSIASFPFDDPEVFAWLYGQTLLNRNPVPVSFTLSYDSRGGTPVPSHTALSNSTITAPAEPSLAGNDFGGWFKDADCVTPWDFASDRIKSDTTLTAKWIPVVAETFEDSNRPNFSVDADGNYLCKPWNYEKPGNAARKYPVLIYLHGSSQAGYFKNLAYMGYENPSGYKLAEAKLFKKTYPCFMFIPQTTAKSWDTTALIAYIQALKSEYRVDTDRVYLHGFSMGGAATLALANAYAPQQLFAGIIRMSGDGNQTAISDAVAAKTSIWFMVGGLDLQSRIDGTRNAYNYLKNSPYAAGGTETVQSGYFMGVSPYSHLAYTHTYAKNGIEVAKKTEFPNDYHNISGFPFDDPDTLGWLFGQSLSGR